MGGGAINIFFFQGRLLETIDYDDPVGAEPQKPPPPDHHLDIENGKNRAII